MRNLSRRLLVGSAASGLAAGAVQAATPGNPDSPAEGAQNVTNPRALVDPGPQYKPLSETMPAFQSPPATDVNGMPQFWASFNLAPKRIQDGGWARQLTQESFAISTEIAGVNMRLGPGGVRELHWHQQAEWAIVTYGACRVTVLDAQGRPAVADVGVGDLWYFPAGLPHSLQGLGPDGCEFVIAFDSGMSSENNTLLVTDWIAHTPPAVLAKNFGVPVESFRNIPTSNRWIYQGAMPPPLADVQRQMASAAGQPETPFVFNLGGSAPVRSNVGGMEQVADSRNFLAARNIAAALVTVRPGGLREMHWHPNADEWQYWLSGTGRMTVFNTGPQAMTADFHPGEVGYVRKGLGHYVENTGTTDLVFVAVFRAARYEEVSLTDWLVHSPIGMVAETLNLDPAVIAQFPRRGPGTMPI